MCVEEGVCCVLTGPKIPANACYLGHSFLICVHVYSALAVFGIMCRYVCTFQYLYVCVYVEKVYLA